MRDLLPFFRLFRYAKYPLILGVVLMILGLLSSLGLLMVSGYFLASTALAGSVIIFNFFYPSAGVRALAICRTGFRYIEKIVTHDATFRVLAHLRVQVFRKIIPLSPAILQTYRQSDVLNRLVADVDTLDHIYLRLLAPFITALVSIVILTAVLSLFHPSLAGLIGCVLLICLFVFPRVFYHLGTQFGEKITHTRANYRTQFVAFIQAQAELLLFNEIDTFQQKMTLTEQNWQDFQFKEAKLTGLSNALVMIVNGSLLTAVLYFSATTHFAQYLAPDNQFYQGAMIALFAFAVLASFEILMPLGSAFLHIGQVVASAKRITELTHTPPLVVFTGQDSLSFPCSHPVFDIQNLTFCYPNRSNTVLKAVNLRIKAGQKVAILGKTGSGKSSLLQLLVRHYDSNKGEILLAGKPISQYTESTLRENMCFLTQRVHIFSDTLRHNLQLARQHPILDEEMENVLKQVGLAHLLSQPQGLNQWLGDGGRVLSGGEQRRLGLARILLNHASIVLLDEPTEGLDRETERQILKLLLQHCQHKTLIMVTHRLTHIEQFDHICVMDNGYLVEQGHFSALVNKKGMFQHLLMRVSP